MEITWRVISGGVGRGDSGKGKRISSINGRYKMEKPKNLYV